MLSKAICPRTPSPLKAWNKIWKGITKIISIILSFYSTCDVYKMPRCLLGWCKMCNECYFKLFCDQNIYKVKGFRESTPFEQRKSYQRIVNTRLCVKLGVIVSNRRARGYCWHKDVCLICLLIFFFQPGICGNVEC